MIKKIFFIILIPLTYFAQIRKLSDPSIELPEFVITGVEHSSRLGELENGRDDDFAHVLGQ